MARIAKCGHVVEDGQPRCIPCRKAYLRAHGKTDKSKVWRSKWRDANRDKINAASREWRAANPDAVKRYEGNRDREALHLRKRRWYAANREKVSQWHRAYYESAKEKLKPARQSWYANNKYKVVAIRHRRRAAVAAAPGSFTDREITAIYRKQQGKCFYCGVGVKFGKNLHVDHMVPISRGGTCYAFNLVVSCDVCNRRKHARLIPEAQHSLFDRIAS